MTGGLDWARDADCLERLNLYLYHQFMNEQRRTARCDRKGCGRKTTRRWRQLRAAFVVLGSIQDDLHSKGSLTSTLDDIGEEEKS
jgi:hypothetical protein